MSGQPLLEHLRSKFGEVIVGANLECLDPWIEIAPAGLVDVCTHLRDVPELKFDYLNCISGVDYLHVGRKKAAWEPHLEMVYHLWSTCHKHSLVLKVILPRWKDDVPDQLPEIPSVSRVWNTADWHEREVYDLVGVWFVGHGNLRRILCPEDWVGHPLRKDYEMPLEYHGIRGR